MAIIDSVTMGKAKGSLGNVTLRKGKGGTIIASQKVSKKGSVPGTLAQMEQRVIMGNLVNLWQMFNKHLHPSFETRPANLSDFNMWMRKNLAKKEQLYLTKEQLASNGCVVGKFMVSEGALPTLSISFGESNHQSSISVGGYTIDVHSMLGEFSQAVISNNYQFQDGDQITIFMAVQSIDPTTSIPVVTMKSTKIVLNTRDEETSLFDLPGVSGMNLATVNRFMGGGAIKGAIAYIHSRKEMGKTLVSTQDFVCNNDLIDQYNNNNARFKAVQSYGGYKTEQYLTPEN